MWAARAIVGLTGGPSQGTESVLVDLTSAITALLKGSSGHRYEPEEQDAKL